MTRTHTHMARTWLLAGGVLTLAAAHALAQPLGAAPTISLKRVAANHAIVEVADAQVRIRKEVIGPHSTATITTKDDEVEIRVGSGTLSVTSRGGAAAITTGSADEVGQLMTVLQRSPAAAAGRTLLKRVAGEPGDPGQHMLLLTRAVLELGMGASDAVLIHRQWTRAQQDRLRDRQPLQPRVVKASYQSGGGDRGPGDCWDEYAKEAIRIAHDYVDCLTGVPWWNVVKSTGCALVYTIRAEGAMWWFINCSGGFPFSG